MSMLNSAMKAGWNLGREALSVTTGILAGSVVRNVIHNIAPESDVVGAVAEVSGVSAYIVTRYETRKAIRPYSKTAGPEYAAAVESFFGKKDSDAGYTTETSGDSFSGDFSEV